MDLLVLVVVLELFLQALLGQHVLELAPGSLAFLHGLLAAIDAVDSANQSALLIAIQRGQDAAAIALIDAGADINLQASNHDSPWLLAGGALAAGIAAPNLYWQASHG